MEEETIEELSPRAEIFRSKLIEDFQLLDSLSSKGANEPPRFYSNEIQGKTYCSHCIRKSTVEYFSLCRQSTSNPHRKWSDLMLV